MDSPTAPLRKNPYRLVRDLGAGLQGRVALAVDEQEQQHVAIKLPSAFDMALAQGQPCVDLQLLEYQVQCLMQERRALRAVGYHPHVLQCLRMMPGCKMNESYVALVMEYAPNGDLFDIITETGPMAEALAKFYFSQLISAIDACHARGVIHRDIKPENLLFDAHFGLKLCDFGLATIVTPAHGQRVEEVLLRDVSGTGLYMAPEINRTEPYHGTPTDLWAAGIVLFVMLTGFPPFQEATRGDYWYDCILEGRMDDFWAAQPANVTALSTEVKQMLEGLLCSDPQKRLTSTQARVHAWLGDLDHLDIASLLHEMAERRMAIVNCSVHPI